MGDRRNQSQGGYNSRPNNNQVVSTPSSECEAIIRYIKGEDVPEFVDSAGKLGIRLINDNVKETNQLRNFYESVVELEIRLNDIQTTDNDFINLLNDARRLPSKLAWASAKVTGESDAARATRAGLKKLFVDTEYIVKEMTKPQQGESQEQNFKKRYPRFKDFVETVVIYHKAKKQGIV